VRLKESDLREKWTVGGVKGAQKAGNASRKVGGNRKAPRGTMQMVESQFRYPVRLVLQAEQVRFVSQPSQEMGCMPARFTQSPVERGEAQVHLTVGLRIRAGQHRSAADTADRGRRKTPGEPHAGRGKVVQVWRMHGPDTVTAEMPTTVVRGDQKDMGRSGHRSEIEPTVGIEPTTCALRMRCSTS
jgi:hypothetical protein